MRIEKPVDKGAEEAPSKISYEKLGEVCNQLHQQNIELRKSLQDMNMANIVLRLNYLFKVLENKSAFEDQPSFIRLCKDEIIDLMTLQEPLEDTGEEDTNS